MEQQHYFPPLHGAVDCEKCEVRDCWCRGKFQRNRKVYQTKSGYWYCNLTSEKGCPERQVLNLEGYQSKEDILRHMKSLRTDYCILRCSMEGFTV